MAGRMRRLIAALVRTANWRCCQCDTFNGESDAVCFTCGSGRP
jgi:hypothetical protein